MSTHPKGYVDTSYLDTVQKLVNNSKQLSYEQMHLQPGFKVLDVGCGPATDTITLARLVGTSGQVIGVDYDPAMIAEAEKRAFEAGVSTWVLHKQADAAELPFEPDTFDACRSERVFEHLPDSVKALSEMVRVTKPNGMVVVMDSDWGTCSIDSPEIEIERRLVRFHADHTLNNAYSGRQLWHMFMDQRLKDMSVQMVGIPFTDYGFTRKLMLLDKAESDALATGILTTQDIEQLHAYWEKVNSTGGFFASASMVLVSGRKPLA
jgi:ubiquinone/menaquinone biosynthesis C-methylase UbiE